MARRKVDKEAVETLQRIIQLTTRGYFVEAYEELWESYKIFNDGDGFKNTEIVNGRKFYSGFYYDLREFCDSYALPFNTASHFIMTMLGVTAKHAADPDYPGDAKEILGIMWFLGGEKGDLESFKDWFENCPPQEHWYWFRIAKTGAGLPSPDDIYLANVSVGQFTPQMRKRDYTSGLPISVIAEIFKVSDRTVGKAIKSCWTYLTKGNDVVAIMEATNLAPEVVFNLLEKAEE